MRYVALKYKDIARTQYNGHGGIRALVAHHEARAALHAQDHRRRLARQALAEVRVEVPVQPLLAAARQRIKGIYLAWRAPVELARLAERAQQRRGHLLVGRDGHLRSRRGVAW